jgi:hypothetical protein
MAAGRDVVNVPPTGLDHRDVGVVVAQDGSELLLGKPVDPPVSPQNCPKIT